MTEFGWIDAALRAARSQAIGALLRYFRDLDQAEEAFQEACLRALRHWPVNGPPRDPAAWLILVGRNAALDDMRRRKHSEPLVIDGPFAETKEQLLGFYIVDCATLEAAIEAARQMGHGESGALEIRPVRLFEPGAAGA